MQSHPQTTTGPKPESFREFVETVNRKYRWFTHCSLMADVAERIASGELKRVMFFLPPRHGKSETISRLFTAYFLSRHPEWFVGLACYGQDLADTLSRAAQNNYTAAGGVLESANVRHWTTPEGGGFWSAGVGGPITGKGAHLLVIDDPIKDAEESVSPTVREKVKEWYQSVFSTREEPWSDTDQTAAIVVIQTRWHEQDLAGWLLEQEREARDNEEDAERWHIVCLPALKEKEDQAFPPSCTVEPDWRKPGEALCPERRSAGWLERLRRRLKAGYWWTALYQQHPRPIDGTFVKRQSFKFVVGRPRLDRWVRFYDTSLTKGGDATGTGLLGKDVVNGKTRYIGDEWAQHQIDAEELVPLILANRQSDPEGTVIAIERSTASISAIRELITSGKLEGTPLFEITTKGKTKLGRGLGWLTHLSMGNLYLVAGSWNADAIDTLCRFKGDDGDDDDLFDGVSVGHAALYMSIGGATASETATKRGSLKELLELRGVEVDDEDDL